MVPPESWLSKQSRRRKTSSMLSPDRAGPRQALTVLRISRAHGSSTAEHALTNEIETRDPN